MQKAVAGGATHTAAAFFIGQCMDIVKKDIILKPEFIEELKGLLTEGEFTARWTIIETYHTLGRRIVEESAGSSIDHLVQALAPALERSERSLWYAIQFYKKFPEIQQLPEGKSISWNKIITQYLPQGKTTHEHQWNQVVWLCSCGARKPFDLKEPTGV